MNGSRGFRDCKRCAAHANFDTCCERSENPGNISERNDKRRRNQPIPYQFPPGLRRSPTPLGERIAENKSVTDTVAVLKLKEKNCEMTSHMIETTLDVRPIDATRYRAVPKARGFKRTYRNRSLYGLHRACRVIVGIANLICRKKELIATLLYLLQKAECRGRHGRVPGPEN